MALPFSLDIQRQHYSQQNIKLVTGLEHLHNLVPPLVHTHFRTRNVLVDESFNAKVSDYGFLKMQTSCDHAGSSSNIDCFLDPEYALRFKVTFVYQQIYLLILRYMGLVLQRSNISQEFSEKSDVYSFGVFLLELISGREAHNRNQSNPQEDLVFQVNMLSKSAYGSAVPLFFTCVMCRKSIRSHKNGCIC